jgi:hypothetical protein
MELDDILKLVPYGTPSQFAIDKFVNEISMYREIYPRNSDDFRKNYQRSVTSLKWAGQDERFEKAVQMSKANELDDSNEVLLKLTEFNEFPPYPVYERLAINYRKQHRYLDEYQCCQEFLKEKSKHEYNDFVYDKFQKRLEKAKLLYKKQQARENSKK